jgi:hypothetical protein
MRAHRRVIKRNLNVRIVVEAAEAELRALDTRLAVLKGNLKKLDAAWRRPQPSAVPGSPQGGESC